MDVGITVPQTPIAVAPGGESRIGIEVQNRSAEALSVRLSVAHSRAGAWAHAEPPVLELAAGESTVAHLTFRPPLNATAGATLMPFTVQAEDLRYGVLTGRATGLLNVASQESLSADLSRESARPGLVVLQVRLGNRNDSPLTVKLEPHAERDDVRVEVTPAVIDVSGGEMATARLRLRPRARLAMFATPYEVSVSCKDVAAPADDPPLAVMSDTGTVPSKLGKRVVVPLIVTLLAVVGAATLLLTGAVQLPGRGPGGTSTAQAEAVSRPYALVDVFPQQGGLGRQLADAARARLTEQGMAVRLVDSTKSPDLADGQGGLWVLLQDGFGSTEEARAYCDRYRPLAPKCEVVS
jgi:hypothetical protein